MTLIRSEIMKMSLQTQQNISIKLNQYEQILRELHKLKFHLRMKKKLYDQSQYRNITDRVKQCETYFKKNKKETIHKQADKILGKKTAISNHSRIKTLIENERESNRGNRSIIKDISKKQINYCIKLKSQQTELSKSRFILQYDLQPIVKKNNKQENPSPIDYDTNQNNRRNDRRFVSDFEKNIKQKLKKIELNKYEDIEEFDEIIKRNQQPYKQPQIKTDKISKTNSLKLQVLSPTHPTKKKRYLNSTKQHDGRTIEAVQSQRYQSLRSKIDRCRTELSQRQKDQIDRINHRKVDSMEKSKILSNFYQKYSSHQKNGDAQALELMCKATLARADLLLKQI